MDPSKTLINKSALKSKRSVNVSSKSEGGQSQTTKLDLLTEQTYNLISQFFENYSTKRQEQQALKGSVCSDNGSQVVSNQNMYQIRLFFKYQLQHQVIKYKEDRKQIQLFHLVFSDSTISKRKVGSSYQSNMSINTYINSTQVGGASSYRLKTFFSNKGNESDIGNSVRLSEKEERQNEGINKNSQFASPMNNVNKYNQDDNDECNILDTNNQFENKFDKDEEDNWIHNSDRENEVDQYEYDIRKNGSQSPTKSKRKNEDLENIKEVSFKEEETTKHISNLRTISLENKEEINQRIQKKHEDLNISSPPENNSKQSTQDPSKNISQRKDNQNIQIFNMQNDPNNSMINDSILNESNVVLINNPLFNTMSNDDQLVIKNNLAQQSTSRNGLYDFSITNRGLDHSQRDEFLSGPQNQQAEFFSPQNNMHQLLENDEILITMEDQKENKPPIKLQFMNQNFENKQMSINDMKYKLHHTKTLSPSQQNIYLQQQQTLLIEQDMTKSGLNNSLKQISMDDYMKNENIEQDIEKIRIEKQLKVSQKDNQQKAKKKKYSIKSVNEIEDDGVQQQSLASHSSIRSTYGTQFVREILNQRRLPNAAKSYNIIQKVFLLSFLTIIVIHIFYLSQKITQISIGMDNYLTYANLTNSCSKGLISIIGLYQIKSQLHTQNVQKNQILFNQYLTEASLTYTQSFYDLQQDFMSSSQDVVDDDSKIIFNEYDYSGKSSQVQVSVIQLLFQIQDAFKQSIKELKRTSFLLVRYNYEQFMQKMFEIKKYQDRNTDDSIQNINQLYIISTVISCILCVCVVIASIPMIRRINLYKEKIILLVTRISVDDADLEIEKYKTCINELLDSNESYLNVDFFKIYTTRRRNYRGDKFDKQGEDFEENDNQQLQKQNKNNGDNKQKSSPKKQFNNQRKQQQSFGKSSGISSTPKNNKFKQNVISSKIFDQKLGLAKKFLNFLSFSLVTIIFFLVILIFIIVKNDSILPSLRISRITLDSQYALGQLYVYSELLAVEKELYEFDKYLPNPTLEQRSELKQKMESQIEIVKQFNQDNIQNVYGDNIILSSSLNDLKNLYQNNLCKELSKFTECNYFNEGISGYISQIFSLLTSNSNIYDTNKFPTKDNVVSYLSLQEHQRFISEAYLVPDNAFRMFIQIIIDANVDLVENMSMIIKIVFYTTGPIILVLLILFFYKQWLNLTSELNSLSFLLTFIPEQKISEEITLQMLKQIRSF